MVCMTRTVRGHAVRTTLHKWKQEPADLYFSMVVYHTGDIINCTALLNDTTTEPGYDTANY